MLRPVLVLLVVLIHLCYSQRRPIGGDPAPPSAIGGDPTPPKAIAGDPAPPKAIGGDSAPPRIPIGADPLPPHPPPLPSAGMGPSTFGPSRNQVWVFGRHCGQWISVPYLGEAGYGVGCPAAYVNPLSKRAHNFWQ